MNDPAKRRTGLGRGLSALLGDSATVESAAGGVSELHTSVIRANPDQPRRHFDKASLHELAESIQRHGVLQPIVVRPIDGTYYEIVAGERRFRAAGLIGLETVPVVMREVDEQAKLAIGIVENIQREQLNAVEEGEAYRRLVEDFGLSQDDVAQAVHKSRSHVANLMRLSELPEEVRNMLAAGQLTMGHARALLGLDDPVATARTIVNGNLSVRDVEALVKRAKRPTAPPKPAAPPSAGQVDDIMLLERQLGDVLGLKVQVAHDGKGGRVTLSYASLEQLDLICQRLSGERI